MKNYLIYCAGPITGTSYDDTVNWREKIKEMLPENIEAISPMRGKAFLKNEKSVLDSYETNVLTSQKGITTRDRNDVIRCDLLIVNLLNAKKVSIGTVMEIAWADMLRKPIVLIMEKDNIHNHSILRETAGFIVTNIDEAVHVAKTILSA